MTTDCIRYKGGYKYQLVEQYKVYTPIYPTTLIALPLVQLNLAGLLTIQSGYAWDGPSGPTVDTVTFMRGSLIHDALYQLMRHNLLDHTLYREPADRFLQECCRADGMSQLRSWWVYWGARLGGTASTRAKNQKPIQIAPETF